MVSWPERKHWALRYPARGGGQLTTTTVTTPSPSDTLVSKRCACVPITCMVSTGLRPRPGGTSDVMGQPANNRADVPSERVGGHPVGDGVEGEVESQSGRRRR